MLLGAIATGTFMPWDLDPGRYPSPAVPRFAPPASTVPVAVSIVHTGHVESRDAFAYRGGSPFRAREAAVVAVLVRHPKGTLLYDTGFGTELGAQFDENPWWARLAFTSRVTEPAVVQLRREGIEPEDLRAVILSHGHWDHASGLGDFPGVEVWMLPEERRFMQEEEPPTVLPSQIDAPGLRFRELDLNDGPYEAFADSFDVFDDGTVVLVPLPGHTPGSLGMFVSLAGGRRLLFTGDLTWCREGFSRPAERMPLLRALVDHDPGQVRRHVVLVHRLLRARPELTAVPAHDGLVHRELAIFPSFFGNN